MTFRDGQDIYINGQLVSRDGSIDVNGGFIRVTGPGLERPLRFTDPVKKKQSAGQMAYDAVGEADGKKYAIAALAREGCAGCGQ